MRNDTMATCTRCGAEHSITLGNGKPRAWCASCVPLPTAADLASNRRFMQGQASEFIRRTT